MIDRGQAIVTYVSINVIDRQSCGSFTVVKYKV